MSTWIVIFQPPDYSWYSCGILINTSPYRVLSFNCPKNWERAMRDLLDLDRYPIDQPGSAEYLRLVLTCQDQMATNGMFNLHGFVRHAAIVRAVKELQPLCELSSFTHRRRHNIYFSEDACGLPPAHGALAKMETGHHTLCDDQVQNTVVREIYEFVPLPAFIARV